MNKQAVHEASGVCPHMWFGGEGAFGGRYAPEILMHALDRLEQAATQTLADTSFHNELSRELRDWAGRPTPLCPAPRLSEAWGASVWLKREDLLHTGAHKLNNALGQVMLAKRMSAHRVIAETGAGQHGVATAAACARLGLPAVVYMGAVDAKRQASNVQRMQLLGAEVRRVETGDKTLRAAINEALRDWATDPEGTHYVIGSAVGPAPFPWLVRELQSVIGRETRSQSLEQIGSLPDTVVACVGGGSNAIGMFAGFIDDPSVELVGVEAAGQGLDTARHAATIARGTPGVLHGARTMLLQDEHGMTLDTHSVSAGLDYPAVGPEHAHLAASERVRYISATDQQALAALVQLCKLEGILPALESAHALAGAKAIAAEEHAQTIVVNVSGRGDKDMPILQQHMSDLLASEEPAS